MFEWRPAIRVFPLLTALRPCTPSEFAAPGTSIWAAKKILRISPEAVFKRVRDDETVRINAERFAKWTSVLPLCGHMERPMWRWTTGRALESRPRYLDANTTPAAVNADRGLLASSF
jgi:hypothetical protein